MYRVGVLMFTGTMRIVHVFARLNKRIKFMNPVERDS